MTDDLVTRIRDLLRADNAHDWGPTRDTRLLHEAADEIVRLRAERDALRDGYNRAMLDTSSLAADIARAEAERDEWKGMANRQQDQNKRLFFENDVLRALLAEARTRMDAPEVDSEWFLLLDRIDAALREGK